MSEEHSGSMGQGPHDAFTQEFQHSSVAARVPEDVAKGLFANTSLIVQLNDAFAIDFISTIVQTPQLVSRIVLTPGTFGQLIPALKANISMYEERFGRLMPREARPPHTQGHGPASGVDSGEHGAAPQGSGTVSVDAGGLSGPAAPMPPKAPPTADQLYEQLKFNDKLMGGCFASAVLIRHLSEEFAFDFIANFYPRSVVTSRIVMPAGRVPALLGAIESAWEKFRAKFGPPPEDRTV